MNDAMTIGRKRPAAFALAVAAGRGERRHLAA